MDLKRVVVTGLGAVTPIGNSVPEFWSNAVAGVSGAAPITNYDTARILTKVTFGCEVKGFDVSQYMDRKESRKVDKYGHFAIASAVQAIRDSGMDLENEDLNRIGVVMGFGMGGIESFEEGIDTIHDQKLNGQELKVTPFFVPRIIGSIASGLISIMYKLKGPNYCTSSACASSTHAIIDAINLIRLGRANAIVTGGAEAALTDSGVCGFSVMHALSTRNDSPETASRPMSASRDGFVMGEGGGALVLEEYEHAKARGARIYAEVAGWGATADAYHMTAPEPEGEGAIRVMKEALDDAGMSPEDIDYINMHGTSTPLGDIAECKAIQSVFGQHAYEMNLSSTKSMTGHLLGGAGAIEAVASIMAVSTDTIPPTINHEDGDNDENIDYSLNFTFNKAQKRTVRAALSNTFGFGGHNSCIIFKKYTSD
ncbi:MAG: beta-ketoacyl-ACP synthase II [Bacteroidaceae bacterium]|nr:beta-ketoacyl-ACP synthase II [Bacteroidaceae bacterium]